jgi:hypothetical protein
MNRIISPEGTCASFAFSREGEILLVAVSGEASNRREAIGIYRALVDSIAERITSEHPSALVFDLSNLKYDWGDDMARLLGSWALPVAIVVSSRNARALATLVEGELLSSANEWLHDSRESAVAAVTRSISDGAV